MGYFKKDYNILDEQLNIILKVNVPKSNIKALIWFANLVQSQSMAKFALNDYKACTKNLNKTFQIISKIKFSSSKKVKPYKIQSIKK